MENLEPRQLLAAGPVAQPHPLVSLYDYDGVLLSNWQQLAASHDAVHVGHEGNQHVGVHDSHEDLFSDPHALDGLFSDNLNGPQAEESASQYKWPQPGGLGTPITISYSYSNLLDGNLGGSLSVRDLRAAVEEAFGLWATYAPLRFVEIADAGPAGDNTSYLAAGTPDIRIGHHGFDGPSGTLGHSYYPSDHWGVGGDLHLDTAEPWVIGNEWGAVDLVEVMAHELGHSLGLEHEPNNEAIMNPFHGDRFSGFGTSYLLTDDITSIRSLYGYGRGYVSPLSFNTAPVLAPIEDISMSFVTGSIDVTLVGSDADGDDVTYLPWLVEDATDSSIAGPEDVSLNLSGNTLHIDPADHFIGTAVISVAISDGEDSTTEVFEVRVENGAPVIDPIETQNVGVTTDSLTIPVTAIDPEGYGVQLAAEAVVVDRAAAGAYQLQQQHGFHAAASDAENYRGYGEKYFYGEGSRWFYILPEGGVFRWAGSIAASQQLGQLDSTYYDDLSRIFQAGPPTPASADVTLSWSGSDLTIDRGGSSLADFDVIITAADQFTSSSAVFAVNVINNAPVMDDIDSQEMSHRQDSVTLAVSVTDADGSDVYLSATTTIVDPAAQHVQQLNEQFHFRAAASDYYNSRGQGERFFYGLGSQWFYMLASGAIYQWGGSIGSSTLVGQVDSSIHSNLDLLFNPPQPSTAPANVGLSWSGSNLTIDPADGFLGSFDVSVTASDQLDSTQQTFAVTVSNHLPVITQLSDLVISPSTDSLTITIPVTEVDGDPLTFAADAYQRDGVQQRAHQWRSEHGFRSAGRDYYNHRGLGERYFQDGSSSWYYMTPDGSVYQWGGSLAASTLLGQLSSDYHNDLNLLFAATEPTAAAVDVDLSWSGSQLTLDPASNFVGTFEVNVTVSDGAESDSESFLVSVENSVPVISGVADQQMSYLADAITVAISASDADADDLTFNAAAVQIDPVHQRAYDLVQQYAFRSAGSDYHNSRGHGERHFLGLGSQWFYMLADGSIYRWGGSIAASTLVDQLDASYHSDLSRLLNVDEPAPTPVDVSLSWNDNVLTIDPANAFSGSFDVVVTVTDGAESDSTQFNVDVANHAPVVAAIQTQTIAIDDASITVTLDASDPDGDTLAFTAEAEQVDVVQLQAYQLVQTHGFRSAGKDYYNSRGQGAKYFLGNGSQWHYILAEGQIFRWGGSIAASTLVGQVDASYHADLNKLFSVQEPTTVTAELELDWDNNRLIIAPSSQFSGSATVQVDVTAGGQTTSITFEVHKVQASELLAAELRQSNSGNDLLHAEALAQIVDELQA